VHGEGDHSADEEAVRAPDRKSYVPKPESSSDGRKSRRQIAAQMRSAIDAPRAP
jgi:hypothetical protein